jgi:hypothetical protein
MSITITPIAPQVSFKELPNLINASLTIVKDAINSMLAGYDPDNNSVKLVSVGSVPAGTIAAAGISLYASSGNVLAVYQNVSNSNVLSVSVTADGVATIKKLVVNGSLESLFGAALRVSGILYADNGVEVNGILDLSKSGSVVKHKYATAAIVDANTGANATVPLELATAEKVFLNYGNGGSSLANTGAVKINTSSLHDGQVVELYCLGGNSSGMRLYNGTNGSEVFAYINPATGAFTSVSAVTLPAFTPAASPNNQSYLKCMWMNIGSNTFRLVVLDSKNVTGVS